MTRLYEDDAQLYDIAFDWDISEEADWLVGRLEADMVHFDLERRFTSI